MGGDRHDTTTRRSTVLVLRQHNLQGWCAGRHYATKCALWCGLGLGLDENREVNKDEKKSQDWCGVPKPLGLGDFIKKQEVYLLLCQVLVYLDTAALLFADTCSRKLLVASGSRLPRGNSNERQHDAHFGHEQDIGNTSRTRSNA